MLTLPRVLCTVREYNRAVALLDELIDEVGEDERHPLASLMDTLGTLIEAYEDANLPEPASDAVSTLAFLMEDHGLRENDLPKLGSQSEVAEILAGKRELNLKQIYLLGKKFDVAPEVFL